MFGNLKVECTVHQDLVWIKEVNLAEQCLFGLRHDT